MELRFPETYCELSDVEQHALDGGGHVTIYATGAFLRDLVGASFAAIGTIVGAYLGGPLGRWLGAKVGKVAGAVIGAFIFRLIGGSYARSKIRGSNYRVADFWVPFYTGTLQLR